MGEAELVVQVGTGVAAGSAAAKSVATVDEADLWMGSLASATRSSTSTPSSTQVVVAECEVAATFVVVHAGAGDAAAPAAAHAHGEAAGFVDRDEAGALAKETKGGVPSTAAGGTHSGQWREEQEVEDDEQNDDELPAGPGDPTHGSRRPAHPQAASGPPMSDDGRTARATCFTTCGQALPPPAVLHESPSSGCCGPRALTPASGL